LSKIKQGPQESLTEFVKHFHQEVVLIPDLEDGVAYTSFLNGLKSGRFKLSLAEQGETTLVEVLRKAADFIRPLRSAPTAQMPQRRRRFWGTRTSIVATGIPLPGRGDHSSRRLILDSRLMLRASHGGQGTSDAAETASYDRAS